METFIVPLVMVLMIIGLVLYIVPMPAGVQNLIIKVLTVVVVVVLVVFVLKSFGVAISAFRWVG